MQTTLVLDNISIPHWQICTTYPLTTSQHGNLPLSMLGLTLLCHSHDNDPGHRRSSISVAYISKNKVVYNVLVVLHGVLYPKVHINGIKKKTP